MTVNRTTLLDLPLPVTGTESGTWGDTTNNGLTQYLDIAIAGTLVLSTDADVTLTSTEGDSSATNIGATTAQYAILRWTATGSTTRNITALAQSKTYVVINATGGTQSIVLRGAGPTTGVTIISGEKAFCVWNGSDFVKVSSSAAAGGSNTQVQYNSSGVLAGSSNMTFDGTSLTLGGNPTLSAGTANGVLYLNGSKVATSGSALTFDGTNFATTGSINAGSGQFLAFSASAPSASNFSLFGNSSATVLNGPSGGVVQFNIANSELMRLTSTGLGIGTSSPAYKLHVVGGNANGFLLDNGGQQYTQLLIQRNGAANTGGDILVDGSAGTFNIRSLLAGSMKFYTSPTAGSPTDRMTLDSSGNLGLGVTPSGWWSSFKAFQFGTVGSVYSGSGVTGLGCNTFYDGTNSKYLTGDNASLYLQTASEHRWYNAPIGTAGNAITFTTAMTLDANGNLGVGATSPQNDANYGGFTLNGTNGSIITLRAGNVNSGRIYTTSTDNINIDANGTSSTSILFRTGTSSTERARIDSSGNLGVGTTSPIAIGAGYTSVTVNGSTSGRFDVLFNGTHYGAFQADSGGAKVLAHGASTPLVLGTNNNERARITSGGDLLVAKTTADATVVGGIISSLGTIISTRSGSTNATSTMEVYSTGASAYRFYVGMDGTVNATNTTISAISDQRLKENVQDLDVGLDKIMALKPRKFDWKAGKGKNIKGDRGWIAQEFEEVFPDMITTWKDPAPEGEEPYKSVRADLIPVLVKAIQEQQALITSLTARVALLEGN